MQEGNKIYGMEKLRLIRPKIDKASIEKSVEEYADVLKSQIELIGSMDQYFNRELKCYEDFKTGPYLVFSVITKDNKKDIQVLIYVRQKGPTFRRVLEEEIKLINKT